MKELCPPRAFMTLATAVARQTYIIGVFIRIYSALPFMYVCMYVCMYVRMYVCMPDKRVGKLFDNTNCSHAQVYLYAIFNGTILVGERLLGLYFYNQPSLYYSDQQVPLLIYPQRHLLLPPEPPSSSPPSGPTEPEGPPHPRDQKLLPPAQVQAG
eukprot:COSAG05_NODE_1385_length_5011_cov_12.476995_3_plen_155_part_00